MTYWINVGSEANFRVAESRGWDVFGFKSTRRNQVARMKPGDRVVLYLKGLMAFGGIAEITSEYFEDHTRIFTSPNKPNEDYPFRVSVRPLFVLAPQQYLDVREIGPTLKFTHKWAPEHWRLAFQGALHEIPLSDYERIDQLIRAATNSTSSV